MAKNDKAPRKLSISMLGSAVDGILLILVLLYQGSTLDHYLIEKNAGSMGWYFWFLADFLILGMFATALIFSFRHNFDLGEKSTDVTFSDSTSSSTQHVNNTSTISINVPKYGILPFSYLSWIFYSLLLAAKIIVIFKSGEANDIDQSSAFNSTSLKITIAMAGVVFLLLVYCHENWSYVFCSDKSKFFTAEEQNVESNRQSFINYLVGTTVFELLDCVTFLGILLVEESKIILTYPLENFVLCFSCINFLLPTITLYKISISNFGRTKTPAGAILLYKILHLLLVNIPYLTVRIYLWTAYDKDVSLFIVKNILGIFSALRTIIPDSWKWVNQHDLLCFRQKSHKKKLPVELGIIYSSKVQKTPAAETSESAVIKAGPSFHEINLNDDDKSVHTRLMKNANDGSDDSDIGEHSV